MILPYPFVSSTVETPIGRVQPHRVSTGLDKNGPGAWGQ